MFMVRGGHQPFSTNVSRKFRGPLRKDARQQRADSMLCHVSRLSLVGQSGQKWETWGTHNQFPHTQLIVVGIQIRKKSLNRSDLWLNGLVV